MKKRILQKITILVVAFFIKSIDINAQWSGDTMVNNMICNAGGSQLNRSEEHTSELESH